MWFTTMVAEQYKTLPVLTNANNCSGKVYIVTGSNVGLGLETAKHLVRSSASQVILAVRNTAAGEKAKTEIKQATNRIGVLEVWHLDMSSYASVQAFTKKAVASLHRLDCLVANAGVAMDTWSLSEGMETSMFVNVISTLFLGVQLMPMMTESGRKHGVKPKMVFIGSALGFSARAEFKKSDKNKSGKIFDGLNDSKIANMDQRYALTKLVEMWAVRAFAQRFPTDRTGVIINMVAPGLCQSQLMRNSRLFTRIAASVLKMAIARTSEEGSRTLLHGVVADVDSHGKYLASCKIAEDHLPDWMSNADGQRIQKQIWTELEAMFEKVEPGCISRIP